VKDHPENYCKKHRVDHPKKRVHDDKAGIKNSFVHFHIKIENANDNGSLLAFIEGADVEDNRTALVQEMVRSIQWLEITDKPVCFNIFTFGEPPFRTGNIGYLDNCIDNAINTLMAEYELVVDYDKTHISKNFENRLTVSLCNKKLSFAVS
jgi:hypothetical protein